MSNNLPLRLPPGIHADVRAVDYHGDALCDEPTLSSSIAKVLLRDTPRHAYELHPRLNSEWKPEEEDKFNLGSVAHELILGKGGGFDVLDFKDWKSGDAKKAKAASREAGRTPILKEQFARAKKVEGSVLRLLSTEDVRDWHQGASEVVMIWNDIGGALCRAMLDRLTFESTIYDIKVTEAGLSDASINRQIPNMGYDLSAGFYKRGYEQLRPNMAGRVRYCWIFAEADAPFQCRVVEADAVTLSMGDRKAALAIEKWRKCITAKCWPGYDQRITRNTYPPWAEAQWMEREINDDDSLRMAVLDRPIERAPQRLMEPV